MWRWSQLSSPRISQTVVFSTYVEVILIFKMRCSSIIVFSTYVEVILSQWICGADSSSILHVCGGDPVVGVPWLSRNSYSPRMWRWSYAATQCFLKWLVFSTYVEVILYPSTGHGKNVGILHVCGGDPKSGDRRFLSIKYSPRMWRWSRDQRHLFHGQRVFSTYVEVILKIKEEAESSKGILHVCGGDPNQ